MAKFYIVAKEPNTEVYDLVKINAGKKLEEVDLYTSHFKNKDDFLKHLQACGLKAKDDADVFIAYKSKEKKVEHLEIVYGYPKLKQFAEDFSDRKAQTTTEACLKEVVNEAKKNQDMADLIRNNYFTFYSELKEIILNSIHRDYIKISPFAQWIRKNYRIGRDSLNIIDEYYKIKDKIEKDGIDKVKKAKKELEKDRQMIDPVLSRKLEYSEEQIEMINESRSYINLTFLNGKIFTKEETKLVKDSKTGKMSVENKLTIPHEDPKEINYHLVNRLAEVILSLPYKEIPMGKKKRIVIDFDKTDLLVNEYDKKYLNGLLEISLRRNAYYKRLYGKHYPTRSTVNESNSYKRSVYNTLKNSAEKEGTTYNNAYKFYLIYNELEKDAKQTSFEDSGKHHGK